MSKSDTASRAKITRLLLRELSTAVGKLKESDLDAIASGRAEMRLTVVTKGKRTKSNRVRLEGKDYTLMIEELKKSGTENEASHLLSEYAPTKIILEGISRQLDLPVHRSDTVDRLRSRIIDAVIGYRLRSKAIRGESSGE